MQAPLYLRAVSRIDAYRKTPHFIILVTRKKRAVLLVIRNGRTRNKGLLKLHMMAMFFAQRVILGKTTFDEVPKALKKDVATVLIESGLPEMVPAEYGGLR